MTDKTNENMTNKKPEIGDILQIKDDKYGGDDTLVNLFESSVFSNSSFMEEESNVRLSASEQVLLLGKISAKDLDVPQRAKVEVDNDKEYYELKLYCFKRNKILYTCFCDFDDFKVVAKS